MQPREKEGFEAEKTTRFLVLSAALRKRRLRSRGNDAISGSKQRLRSRGNNANSGSKVISPRFLVLELKKLQG